MVVIREYDSSDAISWMKCWLMAAGSSRAWLFLLTKKPTYARSSLELVAISGGEVVGILDIEVENEPGDLCGQNVEGGAFAWEFGVHPEYWGQGIGKALVENAEERLRDEHGVGYMEWWSMDERSGRWYESYGMQCINEHWRFNIESDSEAESVFAARDTRMAYAHLTCSVGDWPEVRKQFSIIERPPLEPRLCRGFAHRF